ncbi:SH3 domain-containing protein [Massilia sp. CFBP9012]|uniref:SH3 domain-containing protein n=1 Tax=Massilia sp. CFBP9012 TaxID=3096531 RepID=UPI002A6AE170|nr:SH3 domain-containing protein [Massilia sp. CFBP9012]MDY0974472.1 SH3 domain-containing protein [Massilia sp. CFBP9012]
MTVLAAPSAHAFDFKTVGTAPAILYQTPSAKGNKLYLAPPGMPLQVMIAYGNWVKVRDMNGDVAWTPANSLAARRNVLVRTPGSRVHSGPDETSAVLMTADKGVLLELADPHALVWARVRHRDGIIGYIKVSDIWGL